MKNSTSQHLKLGIFVIVGTLLLLAAVYILGNRKSMFGGTFEITATFKNINGLKSGNNVRFSGINVGTVKQIDMINDTTIKVSMVIDQKMQNHIRRNAVAAIGSDGLVGSMIVNISPGLGQAALIQSGEEIRTYSRIASEDMLSTLSVTNENAALLTADLLKVTRAAAEGEGTVGRLLNDEAMARDINQTIANLRGISEEVNLAMHEVRILLEKFKLEEGSAAGVMLSDTASGRKMKSLIENLEASSTGLNELVENLNSAVNEAREGEGALHYLTKDTSFVQRLDSTMQSIEQGAAKFNENMEALKNSFLLRPYFKQQERKAAKSKEAK